MNKLFLVLIVFFSFSVNAQDPAAYSAIYNKTYLETAQTDFSQAVKVADSLYLISETPLFKTRSLMLSAALYKQAGEVKKSIHYATESEKIISQTDNYIWTAKVYGFLATQHRILRLFDRSKQYYDKAFAVAKKVENPKMSNNIMGLMWQELAYSEIDKKNYKKSIQNVNSSQKHFIATGENIDFFTANNEQLLGLNYYELNDIDQSLTHYEKALKSVQKVPEGFMTSLIYNGLALVYIAKKDEVNAKKNLEIAQKISDQSEYLELKSELNKTSQKYFALTKDLNSLVKVKIAQDSIVEKISDKSNEFVNESLTLSDQNTVIAEKESSNKNILLITLGLLVLAGFIYFVIFRLKKKQEIAQFRKVLKELDEKLDVQVQEKYTVSNIEVKDKVIVSDLSKEENSIVMNAETEKKIISFLNQFEEDNLFTQNTISLSSLSTYCETNTRYLSSVINRYKKKDFNNYINELRVNYIIKKLKDNPLYRKYKIAVLAEEAGFSSQNKFATIFKKVTSISPSHFISYLQDDEYTKNL